MKLLTREEILGAPDIVEETVEVPEWGGSVRVVGLDAAGRDAFETSILDEGKVSTENIRAKLVAVSIRDETGARVFGPGDIEALGAKSAKALDRVFAVAKRLSGLADTDVEDLRGNSVAGRRAGSSFASPSGSE